MSPSEEGREQNQLVVLEMTKSRMYAACPRSYVGHCSNLLSVTLRKHQELNYV